MPSLREEFNKLKTLVSETEEDISKVVDKNQKAARTRVRKKMQEVKTQAQTVRVVALEGGDQAGGQAEQPAAE